MEFKNESFIDQILIFKTEEEYTFIECTFQKCQISASANYIDFQNCKFIGDFKINNTGIGGIDTIRLNNISLSSDVKTKIDISSTGIDVKNSEFSSTSEIILDGNEVDIRKSDFLGLTTINHYSELSIKDSSLVNLQRGIPSSDNITVENSTINGIDLMESLPENLSDAAPTK